MIRADCSGTFCEVDFSAGSPPSPQQWHFSDRVSVNSREGVLSGWGRAGQHTDLTGAHHTAVDPPRHQGGPGLKSHGCSLPASPGSSGWGPRSSLGRGAGGRLGLLSTQRGWAPPRVGELAGQTPGPGVPPVLGPSAHEPHYSQRYVMSAPPPLWRLHH